MPKFKVETTTTLSPEETFKKIRTFLESTDELKKIDPHIQCTFDPDKLKCIAKGKQFSADILISSGNPQCLVSVNIEIPFLLTPLKGTIQESLQRKLKKALA